MSAKSTMARLIPVMAVIAIMSLASSAPAVMCAGGSTYQETGSSMSAVPLSDYEAQLLNSYGDNTENLSGHSPPLEFVSYGDYEDYNSFLLRQVGSESSNMLEDGGAFDVSLSIPQGYRFAVKVTLIWLVHTSEVTVAVTDSNGTRVTSTGYAGLLQSTYYLLDSDRRDHASSYDDIGDDEWFVGTDDDISIRIYGTQYYRLQLELIFPHGS